MVDQITHEDSYDSVVEPADILTLICEETGEEIEFDMYEDSQLPLTSDLTHGRLVDLGGIDDDVNTDDEQEKHSKITMLEDLEKAIQAFKTEGGLDCYKRMPLSAKPGGFVRNLDLIRCKGLL